jgi:hypothetical protein
MPTVSIPRAIVCKGIYVLVEAQDQSLPRGKHAHTDTHTRVVQLLILCEGMLVGMRWTFLLWSSHALIHVPRLCIDFEKFLTSTSTNRLGL